MLFRSVLVGGGGRGGAGGEDEAADSLAPVPHVASLAPLAHVGGARVRGGEGRPDGAQRRAPLCLRLHHQLPVVHQQLRAHAPRQQLAWRTHSGGHAHRDLCLRTPDPR